ncbi:hypothetical protein [Luteitalea sp.]|uniref:hypothetical protein n=1 Tax=Luteitalea sp. TaxID=2004800 RepID=UPI0025BAD177|nr:hypothetical protein [Luteitalea sp.]
MIDRVPPDKLRELFGVRSKAKLTSMLRNIGLPALPDALGWPIVLPADLERALSSQHSTQAPRRRKRPNLDTATM